MSQNRHTAIVLETWAMRPGDRFDEHEHELHQLAWVRDGVLMVTIGDRHWILPPTLALWIPAGTRHSSSALRSAARMQGVYLPATLLPGWNEPTVVGVTPLLRELIDLLCRNDLHRSAREAAEHLVPELLEPAQTFTIDVPIPRDERAAKIAAALSDDPGDERDLAAWTEALDAPLVAAAADCVRAIGREIRYGVYAFCTNGSESAGRQKIPTIGLGPGAEADAHTIDESISIEELSQATFFRCSTPESQGWAWASLNPGVTRCPPRSTLRVEAVAMASTSASDPTASIHPPAIATACASGWRGSTVQMRPLCSTSSGSTREAGANPAAAKAQPIAPRRDSPLISPSHPAPARS